MSYGGYENSDLIRLGANNIIREWTEGMLMGGIVFYSAHGKTDNRLSLDLDCGKSELFLELCNDAKLLLDKKLKDLD